MAFKRLDPEDFVVSIDSVSQTLFSQNLNPLTEFFTSSAQENDKSGEYGAPSIPAGPTLLPLIKTNVLDAPKPLKLA